MGIPCLLQVDTTFQQLDHLQYDLPKSFQASPLFTDKKKSKWEDLTNPKSHYYENSPDAKSYQRY